MHIYIYIYIHIYIYLLGRWICGTYCLNARDVTLVQQLMCVTWLFHMYATLLALMLKIGFTWVAWLNNRNSDVWRDSRIECHTCDVTIVRDSYVWKISIMSMCNYMHLCWRLDSHVWRDSFVETHVCDVTHSCLCDSSCTDVGDWVHTCNLTR